MDNLSNIGEDLRAGYKTGMRPMGRLEIDEGLTPEQRELLHSSSQNLMNPRQ